MRAEQAAKTRAAIVAAARKLFIAKGYKATSVAEVARAAAVNVDTIYTSVGRKPALVLAVIDTVLADSPQPLETEDRPYVKAIRAAPAAEDKIRVYADTLGRLMPTIAPLFTALAEAALDDPGCAQVKKEVATRRAANMRLFAADLRSTGRLRQDLSDDRVADIIWSTNAPEYFELLTARGWSAEAYADFLADLWTRVLLR